MSTSPGESAGSLSVTVTDQFAKDDAFSTCGPCEPDHGSWLMPWKFADDCCPAAKPGAWPDDGPASHDPQPAALVDARAGQLAAIAIPGKSDCVEVGTDGDDDAGADGPGAVAVGTPVGIAGGGAASWEWGASDGAAVGVPVVGVPVVGVPSPASPPPSPGPWSARRSPTRWPTPAWSSSRPARARLGGKSWLSAWQPW